ncbi:unnamed protein product [Auanema sp. JU1783]|nr:unnamed protein product [Auanema sp. JU1783]
MLRSSVSSLRRLATKAEVIDDGLARKVSSLIQKEVTDQKNRLFAVVYVNGRQWKVGQGDLISLEGSLPLSVGDKINLEKVLMVGGNNFSVFGRPMLDRSSVSVTATVVEKSTKNPELKYYHNNHYQHKNVNWLSKETTVLRINDINANESLTTE